MRKHRCVESWPCRCTAPPQRPGTGAGTWCTRRRPSSTCSTTSSTTCTSAPPISAGCAVGLKPGLTCATASLVSECVSVGSPSGRGHSHGRKRLRIQRRMRRNSEPCNLQRSTVLGRRECCDENPHALSGCESPPQVTGHSYVVYGPLINCATVVIFEGVPNYPGDPPPPGLRTTTPGPRQPNGRAWADMDRFWDVCEKFGVTSFYTAPTAIRSLMKATCTAPTRVMPSSVAPLRRRFRFFFLPKPGCFRAY